jgi:hypothetical protein
MLLNASRGRNEEHRSAVRDVDGDPRVLYQSSSLLSCLQTTYEQRRPAGRSCDAGVIRDEKQLDMVGMCSHVVHVQAEKAGGWGGGARPH